MSRLGECGPGAAGSGAWDCHPAAQPPGAASRSRLQEQPPGAVLGRGRPLAALHAGLRAVSETSHHSVVGLPPLQCQEALGTAAAWTPLPAVQRAVALEVQHQCHFFWIK